MASGWWLVARWEIASLNRAQILKDLVSIQAGAAASTRRRRLILLHFLKEGSQQPLKTATSHQPLAASGLRYRSCEPGK